MSWKNVFVEMCLEGYIGFSMMENHILILNQTSKKGTSVRIYLKIGQNGKHG